MCKIADCLKNRNPYHTNFSMDIAGILYKELCSRLKLQERCVEEQSDLVNSSSELAKNEPNEARKALREAANRREKGLQALKHTLDPVEYESISFTLSKHNMS
ncbi:hypothetical protein MATL_G00033410 [Megalops atlanticus]|uniref:Uncharacterized protein n=1 Tax=Megalops atlanticus TaxID=7932 RepID=A0A9D3QGS7_MEGAT|nr:hypothetical protein MATL_G00033410 [Megalops atlanticus]